MRAKSPSTKESGAAAVEFALVSVLLIIMIVGMVQIARLYGYQLGVEHAAREGARILAVNKWDADWVMGQAAPIPKSAVVVIPTTGVIDPDTGTKYVEVTVKALVSVNLPGIAPGRPFPITLSRSIEVSSTVRMRQEY